MRVAAARQVTVTSAPGAIVNTPPETVHADVGLHATVTCTGVPLVTVGEDNGTTPTRSCGADQSPRGAVRVLATGAGFASAAGGGVAFADAEAVDGFFDGFVAGGDAGGLATVAEAFGLGAALDGGAVVAEGATGRGLTDVLEDGVGDREALAAKGSGRGDGTTGDAEGGVVGPGEAAGSRTGVACPAASPATVAAAGGLAGGVTATEPGGSGALAVAAAAAQANGGNTSAAPIAPSSNRGCFMHP